AAAGQALAEAGWTKGDDGVLRNEEGRALQTSIQTIAQGRAEKELGMVVDGWKSLGVQVEPKPLSPAIAREREAWTSFPGLDVRLASGQSFYADRLHSSQVMTSANRWAGSNAASYANPDVDELLDRLSVTLPRAERVGLTRDLVRLVMSDIGIMPLYWDAEVIVARAGIKNLPLPSSRGQAHTWNASDWDLEA